MEQMKTLCKTVHNLAGKGFLDTDKLQLDMNVKKLIFRNSTYIPVHHEMVWYMIFIPGVTTVIDVPYYFAEGLGPGCIYYAVPSDDGRRELYLDQHVCGIPTHLFKRKKDQTLS